MNHAHEKFEQAARIFEIIKEFGKSFVVILWQIFQTLYGGGIYSRTTSCLYRDGNRKTNSPIMMDANQQLA